MKHPASVFCKLNILFSIGSMIFFWMLESSAQVTHPNRLVINCDVAQFRYNRERGYLELYFGFSPRQLTLRQQSDKFQGGVNLLVRLKQKDSSDYLLSHRYFFPVSLPDTSGAALNKMFVSQRGYGVPLGKYRLEVVARDSMDASHADSISFYEIDVTPVGTSPRASDLELCSSIASSKDTAGLFYKNTLEVVPNPSLVFSRLGYPVIFHYVELYNLSKDSLYIVETVIKNQAGEIKKNTSRKKYFRVKDAVEVGTTSIVNLTSGRYLYQVRILDSCMNEIVIAKKQVYINNPQIKNAGPAISSKAIEFMGLSSDELENEFRTAKYLATDQDVKTFSNVTNTEGRREFLAKFWSDIETGQHGPFEISRSVYLDRVITANQRYHAMGKEGWKTDRGRVYLLYAEPDEIERVPSSSESKPYEIWHYNQIESGVIFVFIDRNGFGEYTLVHSTKRGELQDETWQRYLQ